METPIVQPKLSGGEHSLRILNQLTDTRLSAAGLLKASRVVSELGWQRAQSYSIQRDAFRSVWHAGHVTSLLTNGVDVIAGNQSGGVWLLHKVGVPTAVAGYTGLPLSDGWDSPDVSCLAWMEAGTLAVAGTGGQALFLLQFQVTLGGHLEFVGSTTLPVPFSKPVGIVTLADPPRMVVLTGVNAWWSPIPQPASNVSGYVWQAAEGLGSGRFTGIAAGSAGSVAVAGFGGRPSGIGTPPPGGVMYRGSFVGGALVFTEAKVSGLDLAKMRTTSVASCEDQRDRMYAVAAGPDNQVLGVIASRDGGVSWQGTGAPDKAQAGFQGWYNNCIAVSPRRPDLVVIGWLSGGPFFSENAGKTWRHPDTQESNVHLHNDLHTVVLSRGGAAEDDTLFVGGDGGIAVSHDLGVNYHSEFNRPLNNLQFYGGSRPTMRQSYGGTFTASSRYPGLLAGGLQDNGNVYRAPDRRRGSMPRQADTPWFRHFGGDGDINRFVDALGALLNSNNTSTSLGLALWDEAAGQFPSGPGTMIAADDGGSGVVASAVEAVAAPHFRKDGKLVFAATGSGDSGVIHGLVADDPAQDRPDASNAKLVKLGSVGEVVTAIASRDGASMLVGTDSGRIVSFDSASGAATPFALPDLAKGIVYRIEIFPTPFLAGSLPDAAFALVGGRVLYFNGLFWSTTTGTDWETFAYDAESGRLFGATDGDVFVSADKGKTWLDASVGLPARPHCSDMRIAADGSGGRDLYLATYGQSVWRASIAQRANILELPPEAVDALLGVIEDGGGLLRSGGHIIKIPPSPLLGDLLKLLSIGETARTLSESSLVSSVALQRAALQELASVALRAADRIGNAPSLPTGNPAR